MAGLGDLLGVIFSGGGGSTSKASTSTTAFGVTGASGINSPTNAIEFTAGKKAKVTINSTDPQTLQAATDALQSAETTLENANTDPTRTILEFGLAFFGIFLAAKFLRVI